MVKDVTNDQFKNEVTFNIDRGGGAVVRALAPQAEGCAFESKPRQTLDVKVSSNSSTAKCSVIDVECHGRRLL